MKKILFLILSFICFISISNAKAVCNIISGTGSNIGDEIECANEHFYIIDSDENNIKMLAKYNLYTGSIIDKKEELFTSSVGSNLNAYCQNKYGEGYKSGKTVNNTSGEAQYYCYKKNEITDEEVKQNKIALGAHGGYEGHPEYPEVGVVQFILVARYLDSTEEIPYLNYDFMEYVSDLDKYKEYTPEFFEKYTQYLSSKNLEVKNMKLITIDEINKIVKNTTNKELPLDKWGKESWETVLYHYGIQDNGSLNYYKVGSLKDNIDKKYDWLWSTTYWTQTMYYSGGRGTGYVYFVDTLGNICADYDCPTNFGAGIRPVVTISKDSIIYKIKTKTDGNGTLTSEKVEAYGGEVIKFTVKPNEGYELGVIKVTDDKGNVVYFKDYTFTMPNANVLIEATFKKVETKNPKTKDALIITATIIFIISLISTIYYYQKRKTIINETR